MAKKRITQDDIARKVGLDRTAVTRILNNDPSYRTDETVRRLVTRTAEKMGYDLSYVRSHRKEWEERIADLEERVKRLEDAIEELED